MYCNQWKLPCHLHIVGTLIPSIAQAIRHFKPRQNKLRILVDKDSRRLLIVVNKVPCVLIAPAPGIESILAVVDITTIVRFRDKANFFKGIATACLILANCRFDQPLTVGIPHIFTVDHTVRCIARLSGHLGFRQPLHIDCIGLRLVRITVRGCHCKGKYIVLCRTLAIIQLCQAFLWQSENAASRIFQIVVRTYLIAANSRRSLFTGCRQFYPIQSDDQCRTRLVGGQFKVQLICCVRKTDKVSVVCVCILPVLCKVSRLLLVKTFCRQSLDTIFISVEFNIHIVYVFKRRHRLDNQICSRCVRTCNPFSDDRKAVIFINVVPIF